MPKTLHTDTITNELKGASAHFAPRSQVEEEELSPQAANTLADEATTAPTDVPTSQSTGVSTDRLSGVSADVSTGQSTNVSTGASAGQSSGRATDAPTGVAPAPANGTSVVSADRPQAPTDIDTTPVQGRPRSFYLTQKQHRDLDIAVARLETRLNGNVPQKMNRSTLLRLLLEVSDVTSEATIERLAAQQVKRLLSQLTEGATG